MRVSAELYGLWHMVEAHAATLDVGVAERLETAAWDLMHRRRTEPLRSLSLVRLAGLESPVRDELPDLWAAQAARARRLLDEHECVHVRLQRQGGDVFPGRALA